MIWSPHSTVATIVERNKQFLMVEEIDHGARVFNQPAGHLEANESLFDAAIRETLEETAWDVELNAFLGLYQYRSPNNGATYLRHCFVATPLQHNSEKELDSDIIAAHWLSAETILSADFTPRSPLVTKVIHDYLAGIRYPLELIYLHKD